jgi:hypothetical protein
VEGSFFTELIPSQERNFKIKGGGQAKGKCLRTSAARQKLPDFQQNPDYFHLDNQAILKEAKTAAKPFSLCTRRRGKRG